MRKSLSGLDVSLVIQPRSSGWWLGGCSDALHYRAGLPWGKLF